MALAWSSLKSPPGECAFSREERPAQLLYTLIKVSLQNECWRSSPWGGGTPRVENISRNNSRALPSQLIIPIISSTLSNLCPHTSFHIAHVQSCPISGTSKLRGPASQQPQPNVIAGRCAQVTSVALRWYLCEIRLLYPEPSAGRLPPPKH